MDHDSQKAKDASLSCQQFNEQVRLYSQQIDDHLKLIDSPVAKGISYRNVLSGGTQTNEYCFFSAGKEEDHDSATEKLIDAKSKRNRSTGKHNLYLKSLEKSITFRNRGNELYNDKKYSDAIVLYNLVSIFFHLFLQLFASRWPSRT